jgi:hypothetical protein
MIVFASNGPTDLVEHASELNVCGMTPSVLIMPLLNWKLGAIGGFLTGYRHVKRTSEEEQPLFKSVQIRETLY